jgi:signal transduction histidine kinase
VAERTHELARTMEVLEAEMERRRALAQRLGTVQEDERRRISRDLHDTIGQLMAGLSMVLKSIELSGELPAPAVARLADAQQVMRQLGREVHGLAVRLRPTALDDLGLEAALEQLVSEWSSRTGLAVDFHSSGLGSERLPPEVDTAIYRLVQEALTNVAKHARATSVTVVVTRLDLHLSVVVEDDGVGFDPAEGRKGRLGLVGMRERVDQVAGTIDIESSPGAGTTVAVRIPIRSDGKGGS